MSRETVEVVRRLVESYIEVGLSQTASEFFHPDAVFEEPPNQPGAEVAHGRDAARQTFDRFDQAWTEHRSEPQEVRALDAERVLMFSVEHLVGRDGLEVTQKNWTIFTLRDGKVTRMQSFWGHEQALEAAGLQE